MAAQERLQVGIIGAGIAGLSAAIAMRRAGWHVELYEKSLFKNEVGAAIMVGCNANRVLRRFGADFEAWGATDNMQIRMPRGDTLEAAWQDSFEDVPKKYGERWMSFHRQDLHSGLKRLAEDPSTADAPPAIIHLGKAVLNLNCEEGSFELADGVVVNKDLVIVSNGVHCNFVQTIVGSPNPVKSTGRTIFRCLVPMSEVLNDDLTASLFQNQPPGLFGPNIPAHNIICGSYPCRNNTVLNVVYMRATRPEETQLDRWDHPATIADVDAITTSFHPAIQALPRKATDIKQYNTMFRDEIPTYVKGRAVLVGDAAHPMLTNQAQGASQAIESAGALEVLFTNIRSTDIVTERLQLFDKFRQPRCTATQIMSNVPPGPASYPDMVKRIRKYYQGPLPPPTSKPWSENFRDFFFPYDVYAEAQKYLAASSD